MEVHDFKILQKVSDHLPRKASVKPASLVDFTTLQISLKIYQNLQPILQVFILFSINIPTVYEDIFFSTCKHIYTHIHAKLNLFSSPLSPIYLCVYMRLSHAYTQLQLFKQYISSVLWYDLDVSFKLSTFLW